MKQYGFVGKGTGKLGASVFAISGGEQIVRQYNPVVSNPNTEAQIAQRAKLKLMSQLGAALAPALGFAKMGLKSARNQFVSKNIGLATYTNDQVSAKLLELQLTPSNIDIPALSATAGTGIINVVLAAAAASDVKRVAYYVYKQTDNDKLEYVESKIVTEAGAERTFPTSFKVDGGDFIIYAYGIKDNSVNANIRYSDYASAQGDDFAAIDVIALFRSADYTFTKSVAANVTLS